MIFRHKLMTIYKQIDMPPISSTFDEPTSRENVLVKAATKATSLFNENTKAIVWGLQNRAVQGMLDFDFVCKRTSPSVVASVYPFV